MNQKLVQITYTKFTMILLIVILIPTLLLGYFYLKSESKNKSLLKDLSLLTKDSLGKKALELIKQDPFYFNTFRPNFRLPVPEDEKDNAVNNVITTYTYLNTKKESWIWHKSEDIRTYLNKFDEFKKYNPLLNNQIWGIGFYTNLVKDSDGSKRIDFYIVPTMMDTITKSNSLNPMKLGWKNNTITRNAMSLLYNFGNRHP